jgi:hypothetical protein
VPVAKTVNRFPQNNRGRCAEAGSGVSVSVRAGSDRIAFPNDYAKGVVYKSEDRADNKQVRELFVSREAVVAVREGAPLPSGTVITVVRYAAPTAASSRPTRSSATA